MAFANVIHTSDPRSFNFVAFPEQNPMNQQYIEQQLSNFSNTVMDKGREFLEASKEIYQRINDSAAIRAVKAAVRQAKGVYHTNAVQELYTLEELRSARPTMQRYIMAEPVIRETYHKQRCDGYSDSYVDMHPDDIGHDHYDYRRVMDGMIVDTDEGWVVNTYANDLIGDDVELSLEEKVDIIHTWELARLFIESGEDPTDIYI